MFHNGIIKNYTVIHYDVCTKVNNETKVNSGYYENKFYTQSQRVRKREGLISTKSFNFALVFPFFCPLNYFKICMEKG